MKYRKRIAPVYFNSTTKTVIGTEDSITDLFKKFLIGLTIGLVKDLVV